MESAQRELMAVLLKAVYARGLLSKAAYLKAVDMAYSLTDLPEFFQYPARLTEEANGLGCTQDTQ